VNRGNRRARRANGKSDTLDAELAACSVLAGTSTAVPKSADGMVEMIRQTKVARDIATKARTSAIITLKTIVVNAPSDMREQLNHLSDRALIEKCAGYRPGHVIEAISSTKHTRRSLARRWQFLDAEVKEHDTILDDHPTCVANIARWIWHRTRHPSSVCVDGGAESDIPTAKSQSSTSPRGHER
jgi:hypothetical protein